MNDCQYRVLVDLSYASLGYCGIAQESRVVLKALYRLERIQPTGLIFGRDDAVVGHRFSTSLREGRRMENQARFIQALVDRHPPNSVFAPVRVLQQLRRLWRLTLGRRVRTDLLDSEVFWDGIWRSLLAPSLSEADIEIARRCPMLLANLGGRMLSARSLLGLPSPRLHTRGFDFAMFHDSQPIRVDPKTCKLIRYYDMIPGMRPDLVGSQADISNHFRAIRRCLHDSIYVCNSGPTREDLLRAFPELEERCVIIPDVLADGYYPERLPEMLFSILQSRRADGYGQPNGTKSLGSSWQTVPPYLLMTSTIEPRKNHVTLIRAFEKLLSRQETDLRLIIVGHPGWKCDEAMKAMKPLMEQQRIVHLVDVPLRELRVLNTLAEATVFPSFYEGFGYGPLEAMCCHTPAIVSDIAAHRWAYGDAATYFDPYRVDSFVEALERLLFCPAEGLRQRLVEAGIERAKLYSVDSAGTQWLALFDELRRQGIKGNVKDARLARFA